MWSGKRPRATNTMLKNTAGGLAQSDSKTYYKAPVTRQGGKD